MLIFYNMTYAHVYESVKQGRNRADGMGNGMEINSNLPDSVAMLPRKEPVQKRSKERFARILAAAQVLLAERGVDNVPMSDIAQMSEISVASLYQYFPDKAAIVATLAVRLNQLGQDCVVQAFADVTDRQGLVRGLCQMTDEYFGYFQQEPCALAIWQATQSDRRLQALSAADDAEHAQTLKRAMLRVCPRAEPDNVACQAALLSGMVADVVRRSIVLEPQRAAHCIQVFKKQILVPAVERVMGMNTD